MSIPSAKLSFRKGLAALADARHLEAADMFLAAMQIESRQQLHRPDMRYLSYYGLSLVWAGRVTYSARQACELALRHNPEHPILLLNLGRVYLMTGQIGRGLACFEHGIRLCPNHGPLLRELHRADRRAKSVIPVLARSNPLNRWAGKLRAALKRRALDRLAADRAGAT